LTYRDHIIETGNKVDASQPPGAFTKHLRSLVHGNKTTPVPDSAALRLALDEVEAGLGETLAARLAFLPAVMDYEGELALVAMGDIDDDALARGEPQPFGLAAANDLSARLIQACGEGRDDKLRYWAAAKSFARFLPVAEQVWAPAGGIAKLPELTIETRVNGELRQQASTTELIYDLPTLVRTARAHLGRPLTTGDLVLTGTPSGVGLRLGKFQRRIAGMVKDRLKKIELLVSTYAASSALMRAGDVVEVDLGHAGRVRTRLAH
jgi:2-keto-4-pentenoate hydratase/2-oxohepta-3-ene-1,7-dioic acid hydratase in catechol pathway